ncbi:hypothetical protein PUMCH_002687 [Australozyma saopauloensis]|uniref:Uncharacterized protein n=1 Tax=Australozyma saopauloensis TaxID=291208 RepID=A0AAX4HA06_9ASCO|nr:hypothetical protein PUMCH_002687 [[Candida] saopauloensis]
MMRYVLEKMGVVSRQLSPDIESQIISESQSGSALRLQEAEDAFNNPYSSERLTNVHIVYFYTNFDSKLHLTRADRLNKFQGFPGSHKKAVCSAAENLITVLSTRVYKHQKWETGMIKSMNEMKLGLGPTTSPRPCKWVDRVDHLQNDLHRILQTKYWLDPIPQLCEAFIDLLIDDFEVCIREHLSQLRLLYEREFEGFFWKLYVIRHFGISRIVSVPQNIQNYAPLTFFFGSLLLLWYNTPKYIEKKWYFKIPGCIGLSIVAFMFLISLVDGKIAFYLCSFHPSVRPLYEHATSCIPWGEANWPYSIFGSGLAWRFWKERSDGYVPRARPCTDVEIKGAKCA